jgi:hypothetical protein
LNPPSPLLTGRGEPVVNIWLETHARHGRDRARGSMSMINYDHKQEYEHA